MIRRLAQLLVLLLVPVLLIAGTETRAVADTTYGATASAEFSTGTSGLGNGVSCRVLYRWQTSDGVGPGAVPPESRIEWDASCSTGWDVAGADFGFSFRGQNGTDECWVATEVKEYDGHPDQSGLSTAELGTLVGGVPTATTCTIDEVCMTGVVDIHSFPGGSERHTCVSSTLGAPPAYIDSSTGQCPVGPGLHPSAAPVVDVLVFNPSTGNSQVRITTTWNTAGVSPSNVTLRYWWGNPTAPSRTDAPVYASLGNGPNQQWQYTVTGDFSPGVNEPAQTLGVQVIASQPWSTALGPNGWAGGTSPPWSASQVRNPGMGDHIMGGITMPERCSWYFGTKIANDPNTTQDEPAGELGGDWPPVTDPPPIDDCEAQPDPGPECDPPPVETEGCGFKISDPSTWAGAGICELVRVLKSALGILQAILDAIGGVAAAILGGLSDLLEALFIPSPGFLDGKVDQVKDAWDDTPPGEIVGIVSDLDSKFSTPASGGCAGLAVPVDWPVLGGGTSTLHPFSTCEPGMARIADVAHVCLQAIVWFGALLVGFRVLAASLGYQVRIGGGGDE